jgi:hypothetical protein
LFDSGGSGKEVDELTSEGDGEELGEEDDVILVGGVVGE